MRAFLKQLVESHIAKKMRGDQDKIRIFIKHERFDLFIDRLHDQLTENIRKLGKAKTERVIRSSTDLFMENVLKHYEEKALSDVEKQRRLDDAERLEKIAEEVSHETDIVENSKKIISRPGKVARHEAD